MRLFSKSKEGLPNKASVNEKTQPIVKSKNDRRPSINEKPNQHTNTNNVSNPKITINDTELFTNIESRDSLADEKSNTNIIRNSARMDTVPDSRDGAVILSYNAFGDSDNSTPDIRHNNVTNDNSRPNVSNTQFKVRTKLGTPLMTAESEYSDFPNSNQGNKLKRTQNADGNNGSNIEKSNEGDRSSKKARTKGGDDYEPPQRHTHDDKIKKILYETFLNVQSLIKQFAFKYINYANGDKNMIYDLIKMVDFNNTTSEVQDYKGLLDNIYSHDPYFADQLKANVGISLMELYKVALKNEMGGQKFTSDNINENTLSQLFGEKSMLNEIDDLAIYYLSKAEMPGSISSYNEEFFSKFTGNDGNRLDVLSLLNKRKAIKERLKMHVKNTIKKYPQTYIGDATFVFTDYFMAKITNTLNLITIRTTKRFTLKQILSSPLIDTMFVALMNIADKNSDNLGGYKSPISDPYNSTGSRGSGNNIADRLSNGSYNGSASNLSNPMKYNRGNTTIINGRASVANISSTNSELNSILANFKYHVKYDMQDDNKLIFDPNPRNTSNYGVSNNSNTSIGFEISELSSFEKKQAKLFSKFVGIINCYSELILNHKEREEDKSNNHTDKTRKDQIVSTPNINTEFFNNIGNLFSDYYPTKRNNAVSGNNHAIIESDDCMNYNIMNYNMFK